jgi:hypothetical protein
MPHQVGGAVCGLRIIPLRGFPQGINLPDVCHEKLAGVIWRHPQAIKIDVFPRFPKIRSDPNQVALIPYHVVKFVLLKEAFEGGVPLALLLAGFNGEGHEVPFLKPEADRIMTGAQIRITIRVMIRRIARSLQQEV